MTRNDREQTRRFLDAYDRGAMPGVTIPEAVLTVLRQSAEAPAEDAVMCDMDDCPNEATWRGVVSDRAWCPDHGTHEDWMAAYTILRGEVDAATAETNLQECVARLRKAIAPNL